MIPAAGLGDRVALLLGDDCIKHCTNSPHKGNVSLRAAAVSSASFGRITEVTSHFDVKDTLS